MKDKAMANELIKLYSVQSEMRNTEKKLALATGSRFNAAKKTTAFRHNY